MRPDHHIAGAEAAHRRLADTLAQLTDADVRAPSLLPGWNVAMTLTHIARNADSLRRMLDGARGGQVLDQYERGAEGRAADIEAGRNRDRAFLVADVQAASALLEESWHALDAHTWEVGEGRFTTAERAPVRALPYRRWREVEIHHRDLGLAYTEADWPDDFVALDLADMLAEVPGRLSPADRRRWLAWLLGRTPPPDLDALQGTT
jgi:maleylpyruvate isomerase